MEKQSKRCLECFWDGFFFLGGSRSLFRRFCTPVFFSNHVMLIFSGVVCTPVFLADVILPDYFAGVFVTPEIKMFCFHTCVLKRLCPFVH